MSRSSHVSLTRKSAVNLNIEQAVNYFIDLPNMINVRNMLEQHHFLRLSHVDLDFFQQKCFDSQQLIFVFRECKAKRKNMIRLPRQQLHFLRVSGQIMLFLMKRTMYKVM